MIYSLLKNSSLQFISRILREHKLINLQLKYFYNIAKLMNLVKLHSFNSFRSPNTSIYSICIHEVYLSAPSAELLMSFLGYGDLGEIFSFPCK